MPHSVKRRPIYHGIGRPHKGPVPLSFDNIKHEARNWKANATTAEIIESYSIERQIFYRAAAPQVLKDAAEHQELELWYFFERCLITMEEALL